MNGVHDLGGMDGFGPVQPERDEPVFHEPWEGRVFGMSMLGAGVPPSTIDALRHRIERIAPAQYLGSSYYERWLAAMENVLLEAGTLSREEIEAKVRQFASDPDLQIPRHGNPELAEKMMTAFRRGNTVTRKIRQRPRFVIGDKIVTRNLNPHGHTRLPRYARGKRGTVVLHHGAHVFPDTNAHGLGENPQHLYTVRIAARELWGDSAEANESTLVDLWESYLEKDKTAAVSKQPGEKKEEREPRTKKTGPTAKGEREANGLKRAAKAEERGGRGQSKKILPKKKAEAKSSARPRKSPGRPQAPLPKRKGR